MKPRIACWKALGTLSNQMVDPKLTISLFNKISSFHLHSAGLMWPLFIIYKKCERKSKIMTTSIASYGEAKKTKQNEKHLPVNECTFGVHQIKLVIKTSPGLPNGCGVAQHADSPLYFGQVTTGYDCRGLVVDAHLEPCRTPVDKLNAPSGLDVGDCSVHVFRYDVTTE